MNSAPARVPTQAQEAAAGRLLTLLVEGAAEAQALAEAGEGTALNALLESRARMLEELDRTVRALGAEAARPSVARAPMGVSRRKMIDMAVELEAANAVLLRTAKAECVSLAAAITATNRPDGVASAYAGRTGSSATRLDLLL